MVIFNKKYPNLFQIFSLILIILILSSLTNKTTFKINNQTTFEMQQNENSFEEIKTLAILGNYFGDSYFWIKDLLESWGCNVTTAGLTAVVSSCPHKPPRPVTVNITTPEITREIIKQFDCIWIPSGAHWTYLIPNTIVHNILSIAYEEGLTVAAICIGTLVLAYANGIVDGVKVVYYSESIEKMMEENATIVYNTNVVSDKGIITAGTGLHQSTNYAVYPFCVAITKAVLGYTSVVSTTYDYSISESNSNHSLTVSTNNLSDIYYGNESTDILSVKAILNSENELLNNEIFTLYDEDEDGVFERNFTLTTNDDFTIDLEIKSAAWGIESIRSVEKYSTISLAVDFHYSVFFISMSIISYTYIKRKKKFFS
ncbi:MAG: DJ-1/PfpI family protein [Asgard group archaeon]|nr:DJ-1/PfpI family protein [Asgard group archaeon]